MDDTRGGKMIYVTFHSVSSALYLEKLLRRRHIRCAIIPVPRELSSSCGYAAELEAIDPARLKDIMGDAIEWERIYGRNDGFYLLEEAGM